MGFGPFVLISLFYAILGLRVVAQLLRSWRQTFDRRFTPADRALVDQTAFFVLVPVAVALHELGHAVAIRALGGTVEGWGYFGFAGYVAYDPTRFSDVERVAIAAAGTLVNLLLGAAAVALVFLRRPPLRAAFNELLLQFTFISLLNALVLYPLLDVFSGFGGDWSQIYFGGVPALSGVILVVHVGVLGLLLWGWKSEAMRARIAALTGALPGPRRIALGGEGGAPRDSVAAPEDGLEATLTEAARRVASGWPVPVEAGLQRHPEGPLLVLSWSGGGARRSLLALARASGVTLTGVAAWPGSGPPVSRTIGEERGRPNADRLTLALRLGMEALDGWRPAEPSLPEAPRRAG